MRGLAPQLLLPEVLADLHAAMAFPGDTEEWILTGYVLHALYDFGPIETKVVHQLPIVEKNDLIRTTALWNRFIKFPTTFVTLSSN